MEMHQTCYIPHSAIFLISSTLSTFFSKNYKSNYGKCGLGLSSDCVLHKRTVTLIRASRDGKKKKKKKLFTSISLPALVLPH